MTKKAGMESWKRKRRQEYLERKEFRYYIFCEGEQTEPQYFSSFKKYIESNPIYKNLVLIEIMLPILRILSQQGIKTLYFCDVIKELKCNKGLAI